MSKKTLKVILLLLLLIVIIFLGLRYHRVIQSRFDVDNLTNMVEKFGVFGEIIYVLVISIRPILFIPSPAVFVIGGVIFGTIKGSMFNIVGILANASLGYWLAGRFKGIFYRFAGEKHLKSFENIDKNDEVKALFTMRVTPGFPFDPISYASGLVGIPFRNFIVGTALGSIPKVILYTFLGDGIEDILSIRTIVVLGILVVLALLPYLFNRTNKHIYCK